MGDPALPRDQSNPAGEIARVEMARIISLMRASRGVERPTSSGVAIVSLRRRPQHEHRHQHRANCRRKNTQPRFHMNSILQGCSLTPNAEQHTPRRSAEAGVTRIHEQHAACQDRTGAVE